jgi:hypothetical protein
MDLKVIQWEGVSKIQVDPGIRSKHKLTTATRPRTPDPKSISGYDLRVLITETDTD